MVFAAIGLGGVLLWLVERGLNDSIASPIDGVWWAFVTATTVGYGDVFPITAEGRGIGVVMMLVGISLLSVVTANIAAYFVEEDQDGLADVKERLDRMESLLLADPERSEKGR